MKKRNVIVVSLLSLSLLTGCTTNKIEHSDQDINQEKVEKAKKEIASENKKEKVSSTSIILPNSNESTQTENTQTESTQTESTQTENTQETQIDQQAIITIAPTWWRECNAKGHRVTQGLDTQNSIYYWCCDDCTKVVDYEICNDHNTPATPEHIQNNQMRL